MNKPKASPKAVQLSKEQQNLITIVAVATVITVFCLISTKALISKAAYQRKVINARNNSAKQLQSDITNANQLSTQYNNIFIGNNPENVIGGKNQTNSTTVPPDGDNGKIVLDALPTTYDFPALLTSISKLLANDGLGTPSIGGSDQAATVKSDPSGNPQPSSIDITITGTGTYENSQKLVKDLERSIRPFDITNLSLDGNQSNITINLGVTTYYQTAKTVNITSKEIK